MCSGLITLSIVEADLVPAQLVHFISEKTNKFVRKFNENNSGNQEHIFVTNFFSFL